MSISFDYYKTFYYVAKYKKISLAAEKLYISQPAVTQTIKKLEEQIDAKLFVRTRLGIDLTEEGKNLYESIAQSVQILDNSEERFGKYRNLEEGSIKIRTGSNVAKLILYDALQEFGKAYPNIKVEIATGSPKDAVKMIYNGDIDIALVYLPYDLEYNNLKIIECKKADYIWAMSKEFAKENNVKIKNAKDLNNYSLIVPKKNSSVRGIFDKQYENIVTEYHYEIAAEQMKKEFIIRNMGIGFIIKSEVKKEIESGEVIEIKLPEKASQGSVGMVVQSNYRMSFAVKTLIKYIKKYASQ